MYLPISFAYQSTTGLTAGATTPFTTSGLAYIDVKFTVADIAGGAGGSSDQPPTVYFSVEQLDAGSVWRPVWASEAVTAATSVTARLGAGTGIPAGPVVAGVGRGSGSFPMTMTTQARFGWAVAGLPATLQFSGVVGTQT
jgi:hypothetical protein